MSKENRKSLLHLLLGLALSIPGLIWWVSGSLPGQALAATIIKQGRAQVDTSRSDREDTASAIWPRQTIYTYPDTAESLFFSLTYASATDAGVSTEGIEGVRVEGLSGDWDYQSADLDRGDFPGRTGVVVKIPLTWRRVNSVRILGDTLNVDTAYVMASRSVDSIGQPLTASHVRAILPPRVGRDTQLFYTVPDNRKARILRLDITPSFSDARSTAVLDSATLDAFLRIREEGGAFQTWDTRRVSGLTHRLDPIAFVYPSFPALAARTDVQVAAGVTASATFIKVVGTLVIDEQ